MTETETKTTAERVLAAAVEIAEITGIESVSHRAVGKATLLSSSNIAYYHPTADDLRRATALRIAERGMPEWGRIEFAVRCGLPEGHPERLLPTPTPTLAEYNSADDVVVAEALLWLSRNGTVG